jgi:ketosteroid isomerase-like protein
MAEAGSRVEIVSLDVTAGDDVAFATALLRCGTEEELRKDPENRLRLTIGLRKEGGRWIVSHEHHSSRLAIDWISHGDDDLCSAVSFSHVPENVGDVARPKA